MIYRPHAVLYAEDTFDIANPTPAQLQAMKMAALDIGNSGFGTVVLAFTHISQTGELYYNDTPFSATLSFLPDIVKNIKAGGKVTRVLTSIGPNSPDYDHIQANLPAFQSAFSSLVKQVGLDGVDIDLEENYENYSNLLIQLVPWAVGQGMTVTAAPYQEQDFWTELLQKTMVNGAPGFSWWHLQTYGGADYPSWVHALSNLVPKPESFLVPGYSAPGNPQAPPTTPSDLQSTLQSLSAIYPGLDGAMMWQYELINHAGLTAQQYATAIQNGLPPTAVVEVPVYDEAAQPQA